MKPTEEQIKEFWEKIADKIEAFNAGRHYHFLFGDSWYRGEQTSFASGIPVIDLNNLFKYAVPKLQDKGYMIELYSYECKGYKVSVYNITGQVDIPVAITTDENPDIALFWASWEVIKHEKP